MLEARHPSRTCPSARAFGGVAGAALVLGHGAGGGIESPDLVGAAGAARSVG